MAMTPIFDRMHAEMFTDQCDMCESNGIPVGWFNCAEDDVTCTNY